tara:strand:+ start:92 stop:271 length:180 start_codon:yes stop_codon:yes gene_type:complete
MKWSITYSFNYDDTYNKQFETFDEAKEGAYKWSIEEEGAPIYIWKLTTGNPIKWTKVSA